MTLTIKILIGVAVSTIIALVCMQFIDFNSFKQSADTTTEIVRNSIGISGYIVSPGNYLLEDGSCMQDLIEKAGGITDRADTRAYLPTAIVSKNIQYYVPPRYDPTDICSDDEIQKVNINSFNDPEDLTYVEGIGKTICESIIKYRDDNGLYQTIEDLMKVTGIGNATYTKLRNYVILAD